MPETHGVLSWSGPGDGPQGRIMSGYCKCLVSWSQWSLAACLFSWLEELINVGANDELPAKVINVPCNSEYRSALLIWFQSENLNMVLNVISHREVGKLVEDFSKWWGWDEQEGDKRLDEHEAVMITAEKVVTKVGLFARRGCKSLRREWKLVLPSWYGSRWKTQTRCWMW